LIYLIHLTLSIEIRGAIEMDEDESVFPRSGKFPKNRAIQQRSEIQKLQAHHTPISLKELIQIQNK